MTTLEDVEARLQDPKAVLEEIFSLPKYRSILDDYPDPGEAVIVLMQRIIRGRKPGLSDAEMLARARAELGSLSDSVPKLPLALKRVYVTDCLGIDQTTEMRMLGVW